MQEREEVNKIIKLARNSGEKIVKEPQKVVKKPSLKYDKDVMLDIGEEIWNG